MKKGIYVTPKELLGLSLEQIKEPAAVEVILWAKEGSAAGFEHFCREASADKARKALSALHDAGISVALGGYTASAFLPRSFFDVHPYWFRMDEQGARVTDANFCASSREAMDYISWRVGQALERLPSVGHRYYFLQDASRAATCHCPACKHLSAARQRMRYACAVLEGLRVKDSVAEVAFPVYEEDEGLPQSRTSGIFLIGTEAALRRYGGRLLSADAAATVAAV